MDAAEHLPSTAASASASAADRFFSRKHNSAFPTANAGIAHLQRIIVNCNTPGLLAEKSAGLKARVGPSTTKIK